MGVLGLWNLIEDSGSTVNIETLRGKTLAIDLSIWINQSIKGFRDKNGRVVENSHVLGLFYRLCKLLHYQIRPIFVFDGDSVTLKRHTLHKRQEQRRKVMSKSKNLSLAVLENYLQSQLVTNETSPTKASVARSRLLFNEKSNLLSDVIVPSKKMQVYTDFALTQSESRNPPSDHDDEESHKSGYESNVEEDVTDYNLPPQQNIREIDVNSSHFKNLPPQTRYEILVELRESYKGRKNPYPESFPSDSLSFSQYQMAKLLKKRTFQEEIDKCVDELNGVLDDGVVKSHSLFFDKNSAITSGRLASDEKTRFILIKRNHGKKMFVQEEDDEADLIAKTEMHRNVNAHSAYRLPNIVPGEFGEDKCAQSRIEQLSTQAGPSHSKHSAIFKPIELSGHFKQQFDQFTKIKPKAEQVNLSENDEDSGSSTDHDDFIEVPMDMSVLDDSFQLFGELDESLFSEFCNSERSKLMDIEEVVNCSNQEVKHNGSRETIEPEDVSSRDTSLTTTIEAVPIVETIEVDAEMIEATSIVQDNDNLSTKETLEETLPADEELPKSSAGKIEEIKETFQIIEDTTVIAPTAKTLPEINEEKAQSSQEKVKETCSSTKENGTSKKVEPAKQIVPVETLIEQAKESAKLARQATSVTDRMISDCQELLRLFGVPFVIAPGEAEAQCAALEQLRLCEGIITDDSDVFLFGGQRVYRNFFSNIKTISRFTSEDIDKFYGLNLSKLICLGMLCGTDYTVGIENVGPVTALEVLSEFPGDELEPLQRFARWYHEKLNSNDHKPENGVRDKFLRLLVPTSFPSRVIYEAYRFPHVDTSTDPFSWSLPQLSQLRLYARHWFGWNEEKTDALLLPVLKSLNEHKTQTTIDYYFTSAQRNAAVSEKIRIKRSKRLNAAIQRNIATARVPVRSLTRGDEKMRAKVGKKNKKAMGKSKQRKRKKVEVQLSEESSSE